MAQLTLTMDGELVLAGVGPHAIGGMVNPDAELHIRGAFTGVNDAVALAVSTTITIPPNGIGFGVEVFPTFVEASSGTHPEIASMHVNVPVITPGAAAITRVSTLSVGAAPVGTGALKERSLFVGDGAFEFVGAGGHAIGINNDATVQLYLGGNVAGANQGLLNVVTLNPVANASAFGIGLGITIREAANGTHANFDGVFLQPPTITAGAAALTNASTLRITAAPTGATNNYSLWVDDGLVRLDSSTSAGAGAGTITNVPNAGGGNPAVYFLINLNGTSYAVPGWAL